jgi:AcrR family transcriptional regulator
LPEVRSKKAGTARGRKPALPGIRFATYLEAMAAEIRATRSGEKSRRKLFAAAARLLDSVVYRDLNVEDISAEAQLAKGTFYVYFGTKEQFLRELLAQYVAFEAQTFPAPLAAETAFAGVRRVVGWYAQTFESNVGLLRCMVQLSSTDEEVHALWQARNTAVVERAFGDLVRRLGQSPADPMLLRLALRTAGGMLDQSLFTRYGLQASPGMELRRIDFDTLVELLSLLLHRAVYASDPPRHEVTLVAGLTRPTP